MNILLAVVEFPGAEQLGKSAGQAVEKGAEAISGEIASFVGDPKILAIGLALVVLTIIIIFFLKKIIINSVLGVAAWVLLVYVIKIEMPFFPSLVLSIIFGLAGIGSILVLKFLGVSIASLIPLFLAF